MIKESCKSVAWSYQVLWNMYICVLACRRQHQISFAYEHFKNSWSGYPVWMFENHAMINPFAHKFSKSLHAPFIKDFSFSVPLFFVSLQLHYQMIGERHKKCFSILSCVMNQCWQEKDFFMICLVALKKAGWFVRWYVSAT